MKSLVIFFASLIATGTAFAQNVGDPIGPNIRQVSCWKGDKLLRAAERDGLRVGAEAQSERPDILGAQLYTMYDPRDRSWGMIASAKDADGPRQCDSGVGTDWKLIPMKKAVVFEDALPVNKLTKLCVPLAKRLEQLEKSLGEVPIGRGARGPNYDVVYTMSENGSWSALLIDKRASSTDDREPSCFYNWGKGMLLNPVMRATPSQ